MEFIDLVISLLIGLAVLQQVFKWLREQVDTSNPLPARRPRSASTQSPAATQNPASIETSAADPTAYTWPPADDEEEASSEAVAVAERFEADPIAPAAMSILPASLPPMTGGAPPTGLSLTAAQRGQRLRRHLGLEDRSALQRTVLLMAVLGPCRANERSEQRGLG